MRVALFISCLVDAFEPETGVAAVTLLRASGCEVIVPAGQTCCGQPAWNSGFAEEAAAVARTSLDAIERGLGSEGADAVVVPAGSCATMVSVFWPELFETISDDDAAHRARAIAGRVHELSAFVAERELPRLAAQHPLSVAYHHSCHMLRELRVKNAPERLLDAVDGVTRAPWPADERCCGFGGLFSMKLPEASVAMADDKLSSLPTGVDVVCGSDSSCLMHLRARADHEGRSITTVHLARLLAEALPHSSSGGHGQSAGQGR